MQPTQMETLAQQLACPTGKQGIALAAKMNEMNAAITARSISALKPAAGESILEIGFGNGALSTPIMTSIGANGHFIGVEKSQVLAQQASTQFKQDGYTNVTIFGDTYDAITIKENSLHGALAVNVLYFIPDMLAFFQTIQAWLRPGGRMVIGVRSADALRQMPFTDFGFKIRSLDDISATMRKAGFVHVASDYYDEGVVQLDDLTIPMDTLLITGIKAES